MTACQRFEGEGLPRFVAGEPLDAHTQSCRDCQAALASYQKMAAVLRQAKDAYAPQGDWEAKVWSRIASAKPSRPARWPALVGFGATLALLAVFLVSSLGGPDALALSAQVERGSGPRVRGDVGRAGELQSAAPGDVLHLVAKVPRGKRGDLRVYRGTTELVFQCATSPACIRTRDGLEASVTLDKVGTYRTLLIGADGALPKSTGVLDTDYAAAMQSGKATESLPVEVL